MVISDHDPFMVILWEFHWVYPLVNIQKRWKDPPLLVGKSTINGNLTIYIYIWLVVLTILKNDGVKVNWKDDIPYIMENIYPYAPWC